MNLSFQLGLGAGALTVLAPPPETDRRFAFDGSQGNIQFTSLPAASLFNGSTFKGLTFVGVINKASFQAWARMFGAGESVQFGTANNSINITSDNTTTNIFLQVRFNGTPSNLYANNVLELNNDVEVAVTMSSTGASIIYKNKLPVATGNVSVPNNINRLAAFFGRATDNSAPRFHGTMDNLGLFDRALTPQEIASTDKGDYSAFLSDALVYLDAQGDTPFQNKASPSPTIGTSAVGGVTVVEV